MERASNRSAWRSRVARIGLACVFGFMAAGLLGCEPGTREQPKDLTELQARVGQAIQKLYADDSFTYREGVEELRSIGAPAIPPLIQALKDGRLGGFGFAFVVGDVGDKRAVPALVRTADQTGRIQITPETVFDSSASEGALAARHAISRVLGAARVFPGAIAMTYAPPESEHYQNLFRGTTKPYFEAVEAWYHSWRKTYDPDDYRSME